MKNNISVLTTVANFDLYKKSSVLFPFNCEKYIIDGTNGMHGIHSILFMMKKLKGKGIDWLIMADEDVIFINPHSVFDIIDEMKAKQITVCGVRDGGMVSHRKQSPFVINTFFSIVNFKEIESIWNESEILENQFVKKNEFSDDCSNLLYDFDVKSIYEPYYCFYFWLRRQGKKILFLDSKMDDDSISNYVFYNNKEILCHTWYARSYGVNETHTNRIERIFKKLNFEDSVKSKTIIFKDKTFFIKQTMSKLYKIIEMKIKKSKNSF
jgi:hypothetical protein